MVADDSLKKKSKKAGKEPKGSPKKKEEKAVIEIPEKVRL